MAIFSKKKIKRGKLVVKGKDSIVVETPFVPSQVEAEFTDQDEVSAFPSCDLPKPDSVSARIFKKLEGVDQYGVELSWDVKSPREIAWVARK